MTAARMAKVLDEAMQKKVAVIKAEKAKVQASPDEAAKVEGDKAEGDKGKDAAKGGEPEGPRKGQAGR